jgi:hypothetical protein
MNVIQSQVRINIADQMANELTMQGYQVQTGGYLSGNLLNAYAVSMVHPDGSQVDINIEPPVGVSDLQQVQVHTNRIPHTEQVALDPWSGFTDGYQLTRSESEILSYEPLMHQNI